MHKTITMERLDDKETKGCYRYGFLTGDAGVQTLYIRKESCGEGKPPKRIKLTLTEAP